jgi:hypothetical protein
MDDEEHGRLVLRRGPVLNSAILPAAITIRNIVPASSIPDALARFAQALLDEGRVAHIVPLAMY